MPIPNRLRLPCIDPRYRLLETDDGSWTLENIANGDTFHSGCGAREECRHVYLENSGVGHRLREGIATHVLEMGLGTATALILTAAAAETNQTPLHYTAIEADLLQPQVLQQLLLNPRQWPTEEATACLTLSTNLITALSQRDHSQIYHHWKLSPSVTLNLIEVDVRGEPNALSGSFDAIYFDPFSPQSNPELWERPFLEKLSSHLTSGGRLVSYCVNSRVRRLLGEIGFEVQKFPGPTGGKREVLVATR